MNTYIKRENKNDQPLEFRLAYGYQLLHRNVNKIKDLIEKPQYVRQTPYVDHNNNLVCADDLAPPIGGDIEIKYSATPYLDMNYIETPCNAFQRFKEKGLQMVLTFTDSAGTKKTLNHLDFLYYNIIVTNGRIDGLTYNILNRGLGFNILTFQKFEKIYKPYEL